RGETRRGVVVRQEFGLCFRRVGKPLGQHLSNALVILLARTLQQRLVRGILNQRMLEDVGCLGWYAPLVEQFGLDQLRQAMV
ncbi:hypothetical protein, partial [Salmonella sp. SAL4450]|uniref:hypothetical protein n=1 Tax=Salmonella sp. SAL4450 TaxID=3159905 RepID=UPI00397C01A3